MCVPVSKYLDNKGGGKGISALSNTTGVATAFYTLDKVTILAGKDIITGIKSGRGARMCAHTAADAIR